MPTGFCWRGAGARPSSTSTTARRRQVSRSAFGGGVERRLRGLQDQHGRSYQGRLAVHDRAACRTVSDGAFPGTGDDPGKVVWRLDLRRFNTKEGSHDGHQNHDLERTQSEFPGHSRAAYLWLDDAQGNRGELSGADDESRDLDFVSPVQSRRRTCQLDPVGAWNCRRDHHEPRGLFIYVDRADRCPQNIRRSENRGPYLQYSRPRRTAPAFDYVERFHRCDLRSWSLRIYRGHPGGRATAGEAAGYGSGIVARPSGERQSLNGYLRGDRDAWRRFSCHLERHRAQQPGRLPTLVDARAHHRTRDDEGIPGVARVPRRASRHPSFLYSL